MKYAVKTTSGNGYHCSCCRYEYENIEEFDTIEEAQRFIAQIEYRKKNYKKLRDLNLCLEEDDDIEIDEFYEVGERLPIKSDEINAIKDAFAIVMEAKIIEAKEVMKNEAEENRLIKIKELKKELDSLYEPSCEK